MADMNGQVALVTGGIRGIGLAICERLINRGVKVADHGLASTARDYSPVAPSIRSRSRSAWPRCRAYSSIMCR